MELKFGFLFFENTTIIEKRKREKKTRSDLFLPLFLMSFVRFLPFYLLYFQIPPHFFFLHGTFLWSMSIKLKIILGLSFWLFSTSWLFSIAFLWTWLTDPTCNFSYILGTLHIYNLLHLCHIPNHEPLTAIILHLSRTRHYTQRELS